MTDVEATAPRPWAVPHEPPLLLPGRSAGQEFNRWLLYGATLVMGTLLGVAVLERIGLPRAAVSLAILAGTLGCLVAVLALLGRVGARQLQELEHGYTTMTLTFGIFWVGGLRRRREFGNRIPWDYRGAWVLDQRTGEVLTRPDRSVAAPGLYPSVSRPGTYEVWTGVVWSGIHRRSDIGV